MRTSADSKGAQGKTNIGGGGASGRANGARLRDDLRNPFFLRNGRTALGGERRGGHARRIPGRDDGWEKVRSRPCTDRRTGITRIIGSRQEREERHELSYAPTARSFKVGAAVANPRASINGDSPVVPFVTVDGCSQLNFLCGGDEERADVRAEGIRGAATGHLDSCTAKCKDRRGNERIAVFYFYRY